MKTSWLTYKITTRISETEFQDSGVAWNDHNDPFNIAICHWNDLREEMNPGDELWLYSSPGETWGKPGRQIRGRSTNVSPASVTKKPD